MARGRIKVFVGLIVLVLNIERVHGTGQLNGVIGVSCEKRSDCGMLPSLGCVQRKCNQCVVDSDCGETPTDNLYVCVRMSDGVNQCMNKDVFSPFTGYDVLAAFLAAFSTAMGAACGLGGGGLLVPLYIVVVGLNPKYAIPLSKATILGGAVATYWSNFYSKHPYAKRRPLIDYGLAAMMEPPTLIGTIFGVMANTMFPSWLILVLLILLLVIVTYRVTVKANKMYASENSEALLPNNHEADHIESSDTEVKGAEAVLSMETSIQQENHQILNSESNIFPLRMYIMPIVLCIGVILAQSLLRGGHGSPSLAHIQCGSAAYWLLIVPPIAILAYITYLMGKKLLHRAQQYAAHGIETVKGDVVWNQRKAYILFPIQCFIAGLASALLGIGGGIVQGPVMLEHGVTPLVQSATASYMILFTSTSTTIQYTIAGQFPGQLQYDYVCWYVALGFAGGIFGKTVVDVIIRKTGRMSYFLYFLAINSACQAIAMGYIGIHNVIHDFDIGASTLGWGRKTPFFNLAPNYWPIEHLEEIYPKCIVVEVGIASSDHDRACETFYQLIGGQVDYGEEHSAEKGHLRYGATFSTPMHPSWDEKNPVHLIGHSYGATTALELYQLLCVDYFGIGSNYKWVKSIVSISGTLSGTTMTPMLGSTPGNPSPYGSVTYLLACGFATLHMIQKHVPFLRHVYDLRMPQWEQCSKWSTIYDPTKKPLNTDDNVFTCLLPQHRLEKNKRLVDMDKIHLFSIVSQSAHDKISYPMVEVAGILSIATMWKLKKPKLWIGIVSFFLFRRLLRFDWSKRSLFLGWLMKRHAENTEPLFHGFDKDHWQHSDGVVNSYSMIRPRWVLEEIPDAAHPPTPNQLTRIPSHISIDMEHVDVLEVPKGQWHIYRVAKNHLCGTGGDRDARELYVNLFRLLNEISDAASSA